MPRFAMELGFAPFDELYRRVKKAERANFQLACYYDHTLSWSVNADHVFEIWTTLTALAKETSRIGLAPLVTDGLRRHPSIIAQAVLTLDQISRGRTTLCIGAGSAINLNPFGIDWSRDLQKLRETIEVIKMLWTASPHVPANYQGKFFSLENAFLQITSWQKPRPSIYQSAFGKKSRIMAGEIADGLVLANESPEMIKESKEDFETGAKERKDIPVALDIFVHLPTAVSKNNEERARKQIHAALCRDIVAQPLQRKRLGIDDSEEFRLLDDYRRIGMKGISHEQLLAATQEAEKLIPETITEKVGIYGKPDDCIRKIEQYLHAGAETISLANLGPNIFEVEDVYEKEILPYFSSLSNDLAGAYDSAAGPPKSRLD